MILQPLAYNKRMNVRKWKAAMNYEIIEATKIRDELANRIRNPEYWSFNATYAHCQLKKMICEAAISSLKLENVHDGLAMTVMERTRSCNDAINACCSLRVAMAVARRQLSPSTIV